MTDPVPKKRALAAALIAVYLTRAARDDWDDNVVPGAALELAEQVEKILEPAAAQSLGSRVSQTADAVRRAEEEARAGRDATPEA